MNCPECGLNSFVVYSTRNFKDNNSMIQYRRCARCGYHGKTTYPLDKPRSKNLAGDNIYFIRSSNGLFKIGRAVDVDKRFRSIQNSSPIELELMGSIPATEVTEEDMHKKFSEYRKHGEWFDLPKKAEEYILSKIAQ